MLINSELQAINEFIHFAWYIQRTFNNLSHGIDAQRAVVMTVAGPICDQLISE